MSLKVLLADDSAAIKKVVQLSLQDYGVELRSVGSGKDVMDVARSFKPDIAFVDVLLPHKTGYEIASEMKKDALLSKTPVVMLWSSFMAFDEGKFKASGAEDKLEKPFEVAGLRSIVTKYVPKTQNQPLAKHLEFPKIPQPAPVTTTPAPAPTENPTGWNMDSFEDISEFASNAELDKPVPKPASQAPQGENSIWSSDSEWVRKDLGKFKVPIPEEGVEENTVSFQYSETAISNTDFLLKSKEEPRAEAPKAEPIKPEPKIELPEKTETRKATPTKTSPKDLINPDELREQTRKIIEEVVWKVVPEIATNIIREELKRLLGEEPK
jgi:CheY-like chemotaxis protein